MDVKNQHGQQESKDISRAEPFEGFDFTDFWDDCEYAMKEYVDAPPSDELISSIEEELGYKLPEAYIWLMKQHNGGIPVNTCFPTDTPTSWAEDCVAITGISGIGRKKRYSLCGEFGSRFRIDEWEYPAIGVAICTCPSAGHDMIFLDYRECGPQGEPKVVHVDQEYDYEITPLADNFEEFIRGLVNEEEFEEDEEAFKLEELDKVLNAPLSPLLLELCQRSSEPDAVNQWIRDIAVRIVEDKGFFALHADENSYQLYDIQFWLYQSAHPGVTEADYLAVYPRMIVSEGGFSTGGYAPSFVEGWLAQQKASGVILEHGGGLALSETARAALEEQLRQVTDQLPPHLEERIDFWHENNRSRQIVEAVLFRPAAERTDDVLGRMAVAYNNLDEYDKAIRILEELRPRQENTPKFHYRLGYAYYYSAEGMEDEEQKKELLEKARAAFTRAMILDPPEDVGNDCRCFLDRIVEEQQESEAPREACEASLPETYSGEEMEAVEAHIEKYFGKFDHVWHELVSPDVHVDICIVPPTEERDYYTLVTMGMGAHRMNVPAELADNKLERAELVIALPQDWKLGEHDEEWYWPVRLLKTLARLPIGEDSWLGWGHSVDNSGPYADNTDLCAALLINPQRAEDGAEVCFLPDGDEVNFYQVIPIYQDEMAYKLKHGTEELLDKLAGLSFVVQPCRADALDDAETMVMDNGAWHLESIHEKKLPVKEITAFNHLAIYLRYGIEHDLMSEAFLEKHSGPVRRLREDPVHTDLRPFIRDVLHGVLQHTWFNDQGEAFSRYYYGSGENPCFPADIDSYALQYFGPKRYHSRKLKDEAYLFIPFDEDYYQAMAKVIRERWDIWQQKIYKAQQPSELAEAIMAYLGCKCRYFPPMTDDEPIISAYEDAKRRGAEEGFTPMLVTVDDTLWECLVMNADPDSEGNEDCSFDAARVAQYREAMLAQPLQDGKAVLDELTGEDETEWEDEFQCELEGGEANAGFLACWDYNSNVTVPVILAEIPVKSPWQVFAYLPFGGWNECPDTPDLMAVAKYWYEAYGAVPASMSHDELELVLPAPVPQERALELAAEQYAFCPDLDQNEEGFGALADSLQKSQYWYFWWD